MQTASIWGAGFIAQTHVDALRANGINIALVVSRTREGAQEFAAAHGIPNASDDPTLLFDESIDCVHVCTPPNLHYTMVKTLLEHGKNSCAKSRSALTSARRKSFIPSRARAALSAR